MFTYINLKNIHMIKNITTVLFLSAFVTLMLVSCAEKSPTACECLKNLGDVNFTKKCNEYEASLSKEASKEWINKLEDCQ